MDHWPTQISGEDAKLHDAVSLFSYRTVNDGELASANVDTGEVIWKDRKTGELQTTKLGQHAIRIVRKR